MSDFDAIEQRLLDRIDDAAARRLDAARRAVADDPAAIAARFPAIGREVGRGPLDAGAVADDPFAWTVDDAARGVLLRACGTAVTDELESLYRYGDAAERRGILRALPHLPIGDEGLPLVADALRTHDNRLIAAALGPYSLARLDQEALRQAVLKCVFVELPIDRVEGLEERTDAELSRMLATYALERVAAGRGVPSEIWPFVDRHPPAAVLARIEVEARAPFEDRRRAARAALADRQRQQKVTG